MFYNIRVTVNEQIKKSEIFLFAFIYDVKTYIYRFCVSNKCPLLTLLKWQSKDKQKHKIWNVDFGEGLEGSCGA
jgi:hypothetical protein